MCARYDSHRLWLRRLRVHRTLCPAVSHGFPVSIHRHAHDIPPRGFMYLRNLQLHVALYERHVDTVTDPRRRETGATTGLFRGTPTGMGLSPTQLLGVHRWHRARNLQVCLCVCPRSASVFVFGIFAQHELGALANGASTRRPHFLFDPTALDRPTREQRAFFNGHKRYHAIKFQGVVTPDGIVVDLSGPELGTRHDVHLLHESGVLLQCQQHMNSASGDPYILYGDPAYGMSTHLDCPYSTETYGPLTAAMIEFNKRMSACRVTVEWVFKEMTSKWAFVAMKTSRSSF